MTNRWVKGVFWTLGVWALGIAWIYPALWAWGRFGPLDTWPYLVTFGSGLGAGVALLWIVSRLRDERAIWTAAVLSLAVLPAWATGALLPLNQWMDRSPPARHTARVLRHESCGKGPRCCVVASWRGEGTESLRRTDGAPIRKVGCEPGTYLVLTVRRGAFGWAWVESAELAPTEPPIH